MGMKYSYMNLKKGNYFPLPNCIFQLGLSPPEIAIYAYLMRRENRESYQCRISFKAIGAAVGIKSKDTVMKYVHRLEEKGLIYTEPTSYVTTTGLPANGSLLYTLRPIQEAKEKYQQKLMEENEKEFARMKLRQAEKKPLLDPRIARVTDEWKRKRDKGGIPPYGGYLRNTPPGNAVRGFYEVSKVLPFPGCPRK